MVYTPSDVMVILINRSIKCKAEHAISRLFSLDITENTSTTKEPRALPTDSIRIYFHVHITQLSVYEYCMLKLAFGYCACVQNLTEIQDQYYLHY